MNEPYLIIAILSITVMFGSICRLDILSLSKHKISWGLMYISFAAFGASCLFQQYDEAAIFGLIGCALNLFITKHMWDTAPPPSTER